VEDVESKAHYEVIMRRQQHRENMEIFAIVKVRVRVKFRVKVRARVNVRVRVRVNCISFAFSPTLSLTLTLTPTFSNPFFTPILRSNFNPKVQS
jgi:hypothetical protein